MKLRNLFIILVLLSISSQVNAQSFPKEKLARSIATLMKDNKIPGLFVSVVTKDSVCWQTGLGYANLATKEEVTTRHLFRIGSISKTFTALAIMKLVEEGKLNLDDKLRDLAPEINIVNKYSATHPVTLIHLLEHKAGFDDMHFSAFSKQRTADMTALDEVKVYQSSMVSRWKPGLVHSYSNPGYVILGYLIEKTAGVPYQQYIIENVLKPLGMMNTQFISEKGRAMSGDNFVVGYRSQKDTVALAKDVQLIGESAGALLSNAEDMSQFLRYLLNSDLQDSLAFISRQTLLEMEKIHGWFELQNNIKEGYGLGMYAKKAGTDNITFLGHNGGINGFTSDYIYSRELDLGIMVSNNVGKSNRKILDTIVDELIKSTKEEKVNHTNEKTAITAFSEWAGEYRVLNSRNQVFEVLNFPFKTATVTFKNDSLILTRFMGGLEYFGQANGNAFTRAGDQDVALYLTVNEGEKSLYFDDVVLVPVNSSNFLMLRVTLVLSLLACLFIVGLLVIRLIAVVFRKSLRNTILISTITVLPFTLLVISFWLFLSNASLEDLTNLGQLSGASIAIFLTTLLVPITCVMATVFVYRKWNNIRTVFSKIVYSLALSGSYFLSIYCIYHDWFALQLWAY